MTELDIYFADIKVYPVMPWKITHMHFECIRRLRREIEQYKHMGEANLRTISGICNTKMNLTHFMCVRRLQWEVGLFKHVIDTNLKTINGIRIAIGEGNLRLVYNSAKRFMGSYGLRHRPLDEFISEGHVAIMDAIDRFEVERGFRFSTYVDIVVKTRLRNMFHSQSMVLSRSASQRIGTIITTRNKLNIAGNDNPTDQEIADWLNKNGAPSMRGRWKSTNVRAIIDQESRQKHGSLDREYRPGQTLGDSVEDKRDADEAQQDAQHDAAMVWEGIARHVDAREFDIMRRRFLRGETLEVVGKRHHLTRERIRQIEIGVIDRMKIIISNHRCSRIPLDTLLAKIEREKLPSVIARWSSYPDPIVSTGKYAADFPRIPNMQEISPCGVG